MMEQMLTAVQRPCQTTPGVAGLGATHMAACHQSEECTGHTTPLGRTL